MKTLMTMIVWFLSSSVVVSQESGKQNSLGVGLGIPYGVLGVNLDYGIVSNVSLSAGIGTTAIAGIGYSVGLRGFLTGPGNTLRPRVSVFYGINSAVEKKGGPDPGKEKFSGLSAGFGVQWMWGSSRRNGFDMDIFYIATTGLDIDKIKDQGYDVTDPGKFGISIGYRRAF